MPPEAAGMEGVFPVLTLAWVALLFGVLLALGLISFVLWPPEAELRTKRTVLSLAYATSLLFLLSRGAHLLAAAPEAATLALRVNQSALLLMLGLLYLLYLRSHRPPDRSLQLAAYIAYGSLWGLLWLTPWVVRVQGRAMVDLLGQVWLVPHPGALQGVFFLTLALLSGLLLWPAHISRTRPGWPRALALAQSAFALLLLLNEAAFQRGISTLPLLELIFLTIAGPLTGVEIRQLRRSLLNTEDVVSHRTAQLAAKNRELDEALQAAAAATAARDQFLANISHEIRTPLHAMQGYTELMRSASLRPRERERYLDGIRRNVDHLLKLVNDFLDLSKVGANQLELSVTRLELVPFVQETLRLLQGQAATRELSLSADFVWPLPDVVLTDDVRLRQILYNLLGNALKFTHQGSVQLQVAATQDALCFAVHDTGIGIQPDDLPKIFEPFTQVEAGLSRAYGGTGLGLTISRRLAEALGGSLTATSTPNKGSTFSLTLPLHLPEGTFWISQIPALAPERLPPHRFPTPLPARVLIAEDGLDNQLILQELLQQMGCSEIVATTNGEEASQAAWDAWCQGRPFDLILMDMQMPKLDGVSATQQLRAWGYTAPIVALTANALPSERDRSLLAGCNQYLTKPLTGEQLYETVKAYLAAGAPLVSEYQDDPLLASILQSYITSMPDKASQLRQALRATDHATLDRLLHQIKGSAGSYGFPSLSDAAERAMLAVRARAPEADRLTAGVAGLCYRIAAGQKGAARDDGGANRHHPGH